jgi:WD40 repeat protein
VTSSFISGAADNRRQFTYNRPNHDSEAKELLATLDPIDRSSHRVRPCMEGAQEKILREIFAWLEDISAPNILWINGAAGAGKLAIASSLVSQLAEQGRRASFFERDVMLSDPAALWRTMAHEIAQHDPSFACISVEVSKGGTVDLGMPDIASDLEHLIVESPMKTYEPLLPRDIPTIIIDALDELSDSSQGVQQNTLLDTVTNWSRLPRPFKLIVIGGGNRIQGRFLSSCRQMGASAEINIGAEFDTENILALGSLPRANRSGEATSAFHRFVRILAGSMKQETPHKRVKHAIDGHLGLRDGFTKLYRHILELSCGASGGHPLDGVNRVMTAIAGSFHVNNWPYFSSQPKSSGNFILDRGCFMPDSPVISARVIHRDIGSQHLSSTCSRAAKKGGMFSSYDLERTDLPNGNVDDPLKRCSRKAWRPLLFSYRFRAAIRDALTVQEESAPHMTKITEPCQVHSLEAMMGQGAAINSRQISHGSDHQWVDIWTVVINSTVSGHLDSTDAAIRLWGVDIGKAVSGIEGYTNYVIPISLNSTSRWDEAILIWHVLRAFKPLDGHTGKIMSLAFSSDGKPLVSGSAEKSICIWDAETGRITSGHIRGHSDDIRSVAFSPDGKCLVSGSSDKTIRVWDAKTGEMLHSPLRGHTHSVLSLVFSPDGLHIASSSADKTIRIWDAGTGRVVSGPFEGHADSIQSVAFSPDGKRIVSSSHDNTIRIWDTKTGVMVSGPLEGHTCGVWSVAFSPDGTSIAAGSSDRTIRVWDAETGKMVSGPLEGDTDYVKSVVFSPDGIWIVSGSDDQSIRVWDVKTGELISGSFKVHINSVLSVTFSLGGMRIASGSNDGSVLGEVAPAFRTVRKKTDNFIPNNVAIPRSVLSHQRDGQQFKDLSRPSSKRKSRVATSLHPGLHRGHTTNQEEFGDNTFEKLWDPCRRYRFTKSHLRFLGTFTDVRDQPGWIFPTAAKVLVNIMQTDDMDTWSGQVEGSEECGMFLCTSLFVCCSCLLTCIILS